MLETLKNNVWLRDVAERMIFTFLQAYIAVLLIGGPNAKENAAIAGAAAVLSFVKGWLAKRIGDSDSAAALRTAKQHA